MPKSNTDTKSKKGTSLKESEKVLAKSTKKETTTSNVKKADQTSKKVVSKSKEPASSKKKNSDNVLAKSLQPLDSSKFAVVDVNGQQIIVQEGGMYEVKKLSGDKGDELSLEKVLLISDGDNLKLGKPYLDKASVAVVIDSQKKDKKLKVFKYKAKSRYRKTYGERALVTRLRVISING